MPFTPQSKQNHETLVDKYLDWFEEYINAECVRPTANDLGDAVNALKSLLEPDKNHPVAQWLIKGLDYPKRLLGRATAEEVKGKLSIADYVQNPADHAEFQAIGLERVEMRVKKLEMRREDCLHKEQAGSVAAVKQSSTPLMPGMHRAANGVLPVNMLSQEQFGKLLKRGCGVTFGAVNTPQSDPHVIQPVPRPIRPSTTEVAVMASEEDLQALSESLQSLNDAIKETAANISLTAQLGNLPAPDLPNAKNDQKASSSVTAAVFSRKAGGRAP